MVTPVYPNASALASCPSGVEADSSVPSARSTIFATGGLDEVEAECFFPESNHEVLEVYRLARQRGLKVALIGAQRSFGAQCLPLRGALGLSTLNLHAPPLLLETTSDGVWVRVSAGTSFRTLLEYFPDHRPLSPPTSDAITVAGALSVCTHSVTGYFADSVRAFSLLAPSGVKIECRPDSDGLAQRLFLFAPGALGALGVITDIELFLRRKRPAGKIRISAAFTGHATQGDYIAQARAVASDPKNDAGHGMMVYGNRGRYVVFAQHEVQAQSKPGKTTFLTSDNLNWHAILQGLTNRVPRLSEALMTATFRRGRSYDASYDQQLFFQRSFDAAKDVLARAGLGYRALRYCGVDPRLTVCHQTWVFPEDEMSRFLDLYWSVLSKYPGLPRLVAQQDVVILNQSSWPAHCTHGLAPRCGFWTASFAVKRGKQSHRRAMRFLREFTRVAYAADPRFKLSLVKQTHCEPALLRLMHRNFIDQLQDLRASVDPNRVLGSKALHVLLEEA